MQNTGPSKFQGDTGPRWARKAIVAQERTATVMAKNGRPAAGAAGRGAAPSRRARRASSTRRRSFAPLDGEGTSVDAVDRLADMATRAIGRGAKGQRRAVGGLEKGERRGPGVEAVILGFDVGQQIGDPIAQAVDGIGEGGGDSIP